MTDVVNSRMLIALSNPQMGDCKLCNICWVVEWPDWGDLVILLQDDMVDDVEAFVNVALILHERGAYKIYIVATHGLLSADAPRLIEDSYIDEVGH